MAVEDDGDDTQIYSGTYGAQVLETGEPIMIDVDMMSTATHGLMPRMLEFGIKYCLIAPMKSGGTTVGALTIATTQDEQFSPAQVTHVVALGKWIASQARLMQQARRTARLAETDALTGLANRARLMRVLDGPKSLNKRDARGRVVGVLHIDLDHFKEVNDTLGHAAGDAILKHAAKAMLDVVGPKDIIARIGGDEFVVTTRTDLAGNHLMNLGRALAEAVSQPIRFGDVETRVGVSIGVAVANSKDDNAERLISNADMALYEVKRRGRGEVHMFDEKMRRSNERRIRLLSDLQSGMSRGEFLPFFQPQVSFATGQFSGFEMLARWHHPDFGLLDPHEFLNLVDETGRAEYIDGIVRAKGLEALQYLRAEGWSAPKMTFNASVKTLAKNDLVSMLLDELMDRNLSANDLVIEVRESDLSTLGHDRSFQVIEDLSAAGFNVELDDFGTGLLSVATLARVQFNGIKLDETMVAMLPGRRATAILQSAMALGRDLDLYVVAEGVETPEQYSILRGMGCHFAQGFGISEPLSLEGLISFMDGYGKAPVQLASA